jgi:hypothetical protein
VHCFTLLTGSRAERYRHLIGDFNTCLRRQRETSGTAARWVYSLLGVGLQTAKMAATNAKPAPCIDCRLTCRSLQSTIPLSTLTASITHGRIGARNTPYSIAYFSCYFMSLQGCLWWDLMISKGCGLLFSTVIPGGV